MASLPASRRPVLALKLSFECSHIVDDIDAETDLLDDDLLNRPRNAPRKGRAS